ncbi:hypothetical protein FACS1894142_0650 [Spirochaetia bacterium]|nr:hypothetical protein FACS1894142_0650 [Spirochaetia bacterium]
MNFFDPTFQEPPISVFPFGLCDDEDGQIAYTDTANKKKWIATVQSEKPLQVIFTAIDKGVIKDNEYQGRGRCDGMLTTDRHIYFVELKCKSAEWKADAALQLESTIQLFNDAHPGKIDTYKHKKAYACNKKHPDFKVIDTGLKKRFFEITRVHLDTQAEIKFSN